MAMSKRDAVDTARRIFPKYRNELDRLDKIDRYMRGEHDGPYMPKSASPEYKLLAERSVTNLLPLVVNGLGQALYVEGYRSSVDGKTAGAWRWWQQNGLDARQTAVHRAAVTYGTSYVTVLPGTGDFGDAMPAIRGVSPRRMIAVYDDEADDWPVFVLRVDPSEVDGDKGLAVRLYDDTSEYFLSASTSGDGFEYIETRTHGVGLVPVVAFRTIPDLEGRAPGEVEPLIPLQNRINQTIFELLVSQTWGSFKIRTVSGMAPQLDENGQPKPLPVDQRRFLMAKDPATKFGQLDETNLLPILASADAGMRHMAVISQTPPQDLLGDLANLSAEALAAARDGQTRKRTECQHVYGESWEQVLRLAAHIGGDSAGARDRLAQVSWADLEARSLAQVADALGKMAQSLGVPPEALWSRIPGVTATDIEQWRTLRREQQAADPMARIASTIDRQAVEAA